MARIALVGTIAVEVCPAFSDGALSVLHDQLDSLAPLCLLCHAPVGGGRTLPCSGLCRMVWRTLLQVQSDEGTRPLPPSIVLTIDALRAGRPLPVPERQQLFAWLLQTDAHYE